MLCVQNDNYQVKKNAAYLYAGVLHVVLFRGKMEVGIAPVPHTDSLCWSFRLDTRIGDRAALLQEYSHHCLLRARIWERYTTETIFTTSVSHQQ